MNSEGKEPVSDIQWHDIAELEPANGETYRVRIVVTGLVPFCHETTAVAMHNEEKKCFRLKENFGWSYWAPENYTIEGLSWSARITHFALVGSHDD